MDRRIP